MRFFLFFATYGMAFLGVVLPGLLNVTAARIAKQQNKRQALIYSSGVSVVVVLQALSAVFLVSFLSNNTWVIAILLRIALVLFLGFAFYFFRKAYLQKKRNQSKERVKMVGGSFTTGLFLSSLNVLPIPYFSGLLVAWKQANWFTQSLADVFIFSLAAGLGVCTALYIYVVLAFKIKTKNTQKQKKIPTDYWLSLLMFVLFVITYFRVYC